MRTLVVDDDPVAAAAHAAYAGRVRGVTVIGTAGTGAEALRVLGGGGVDLVLLDVHLPDTTGLEVLRRLRAAGLTTDVIMVTRARDLDVVRAAVAFGATQYLVKPFTAAAVRAKIEGVLAYRERLAGAPPVAQHDVDGLLATLRAPVDAGGLPKGVGRETLDAVVARLRAAGPSTAAEVAAALGMSRITARRYLEHLTESGILEREPRYGGPGRPQLVYRPA